MINRSNQPLRSQQQTQSRDTAQRHRSRTAVHPADRRRGIVLLAVLAVVALLSLAAWTFCDTMVAESAAAAAHTRRIERQILVDSGVAWTQARLSRGGRANGFTAESDIGIDDGWHNVSVGAGQFTVLHGSIADSQFASEFETRSGPYDLSGLININALLKCDEPTGRETSRHFLMALPMMSEDTADSILNFMAEPANKGSMTRGRSNRPITRLSMLIQVPGVSFADVFAEDTNRNGLLDPQEDANGDGQLQSGWSRYLTTISGEANRRPDGTPRIHLNQNSLASLYDQIEQQFGPQLARFVIAFRMHGALSDLSKRPDEEPSAEIQRRSADERGRQQRDELAATRKPLVSAVDLQRGGLELSTGPVFRIESLIDLFGTSVRTLVDGQDTILSAPWSANSSTVYQQLSRLQDDLAVSADPVIHGRINVFVASRPVLLAIPGITARTADMIVMARNRLKQPPDNIGWLLDQGILSHAELRRIAPFINAGGDYYRATVIAQSSTGRHSMIRSLSGSLVTIDATRPIPWILSHRTLNSRECRIQLRALAQPASGSPQFGAMQNTTQMQSSFARR
jgi:hypothetical protein